MSTSTPPVLRRQVSGIVDAISKVPKLRRQMADNGFDVADIALDKIGAFSQQRAMDYICMAKWMGLLT